MKFHYIALKEFQVQVYVLKARHSLIARFINCTLDLFPWFHVTVLSGMHLNLSVQVIVKIWKRTIKNKLRYGKPLLHISVYSGGNFYPDAKAKTTLHVLHKAAITRLDVERGNSGNFPRHFFSKTLRNVWKKNESSFCQI